ncbi:hypothetical protein [Streptomyces sp. SGAir0957]
MSRAGKSGRRDRWGAIRLALVGLVASASAGFLVGAVTGESSMDVSRGVLFAAAYGLLVLAGVVVAACWARQRAARFGLGGARYLRVGRQVARGRVPDDPAERAAAIDVATRQGHALSTQRRRWVRGLMTLAALVWLLTGVLEFSDRAYGLACFNLVLVVVFLVNSLTLRRQRRRLEHVRRELCLDEGAQDSPEAGRAGGVHS